MTKTYSISELYFCFQTCDWAIYKNIIITELELAQSSVSLARRERQRAEDNETAARQSTKSESEAGCTRFA